MKIKWINGRKLIPKVGEVDFGDVLDIAEDLGKALIKQGQAKRLKSYIGDGKSSQKIKVKGGDS